MIIELSDRQIFELKFAISLVERELDNEISFELQLLKLQLQLNNHKNR